MNIFNNCDPYSNGEKKIVDQLPHGLTIFDVGCRRDSLFFNHPSIVHYFEPDQRFLYEIQTKDGCRNIHSYFNNFGLSDLSGIFDYYPKFQSFVDRKKSYGFDDSANVVQLQLKTGAEYMLERGVFSVDFLKIDTEGYELNVLKGFGENLSAVRFIQFEYGGTFKDAGINLKDIIDYLANKNFAKFCYLSNNGLVQVEDLSDHYQYCNIFCSNQSHKHLKS
jgi:FkbM family methyltransferase